MAEAVMGKRSATSKWSVLLGAAFIMATSAIGPGFLTQTAVFTDKLKAAFAFANALEVVKISNNLGDAKSLITHPATTTHQRLKAEARAELGISDGLLRLSVGLEDVEDLIEDVTEAAKAAAAVA